MSTMQRLTLIGMYNYYSRLFDALTLPEQYDKETFIDSLLIEHGEKLVLYSDIDFMAYAIGAWGRKWSMELTRIAEALQAEYNPIWNYDRYEEADDVNAKNHSSKNMDSVDQSAENVTTNKTDVKTDSASDTTTSENEDNHHTLTNDTDFDVTHENITDNTKEYQISADNSSTYQPERKEITNVGKQKESTEGKKDDITEDTDIQRNAAGNSRTNANSSETNDNYNSNTAHSTKNAETEDQENNTSNHNAHLYGNIGVTTSASMVTEITLQRMKYNLYEVACRLFANELLIGIY